MRIKSEWDLISSINELIRKKGPQPENLVEAIGDDCAVFNLDKKRFGLLTTDISIDSVHFRRDIASLEDIGYKAMTGNISDIAAMGGRPLYAFISAGIPETYSQEDVLAVYEGMLEAAAPAGVYIAGGDTSRAAEFILNIAVYGEVARKRLVTRAGARAGDTIYITGITGDSKAGLEILLSGDKRKKRSFPGLIKRHLRPAARFDIVDEIYDSFNPTAMTDISDGLLSDLSHICERSGRGFSLDEHKLPLSDELLRYKSDDFNSAYSYALSSGEEFELLFTSGRICRDKNISINGVNITPVGVVTSDGYYINRNNMQVEVTITGWDHFKEGNK